MWIITKSGFISAVQHDKDQGLMRVRARRVEHLTNAFPNLDVVDFGEEPSDYRYHCDVPRVQFAEWMLTALDEVDYTSHAKEAMSGKDDRFYSALMSCWRELYKIQPGKPSTAPHPSLTDSDEEWERWSEWDRLNAEAIGRD